MPLVSKMWSSSCCSSSASAYWKPEQPPPRTPTRRPTLPSARWPAMKARTFSAAISVSCTIEIDCIGGCVGIVNSMPSAEELKQRIESALPGARAQVDDLTGGGDHFRAEVVSDRFDGLTRIEQHKLVYDVFGGEVG